MSSACRSTSTTFRCTTAGSTYAEWETDALARIAERELTLFSLHDCYAHLWRDGYARFLDRIAGFGEVRTLDEVAAAVTLAASE